MSVSRETSPRLAVFAELVIRWNPRINLVSPRDLEHLWTRHIADSAQLFDLAPSQTRTWLDLGSGGGFPGLVCAALAADAGHSTRFILIESDTRKCAFLREAARHMGLSPTIEAKRIEDVSPFSADVITARALAPLPRLLEIASPFLQPTTVCLFPKGRAVESELTSAEADWHIQVQRIQSLTDDDATVLKLTEAAPRP